MGPFNPGDVLGGSGDPNSPSLGSMGWLALIGDLSCAKQCALGVCINGIEKEAHDNCWTNHVFFAEYTMQP